MTPKEQQCLSDLLALRAAYERKLAGPAFPDAPALAGITSVDAALAKLTPANRVAA